VQSRINKFGARERSNVEGASRDDPPIMGVIVRARTGVAWCAQLGEVVQLSAASSILRAVAKQDQNPEKQQLVEAATILEDNLWIWKVNLFIGSENSGHVDLFRALSKMRSRELPGAS